jgi:hypothetical protein
MLIESKSEPQTTTDPWTLYLYAMRSPATKEKYLMRLGKFYVFSKFKVHLRIRQGILQIKVNTIVCGLLTASLNFYKLKRNGLIGKK